MGIPYSREINAAFEQVTPLVAAGFKVLRTMKDISILLAVIQVLTVLFLAMILFVLVLLLYSVNPDLEVRLILFPIFALQRYHLLSDQKYSMCVGSRFGLTGLVRTAAFHHTSLTVPRYPNRVGCIQRHSDSGGGCLTCSRYYLVGVLEGA